MSNCPPLSPSSSSLSAVLKSGDSPPTVPPAPAPVPKICKNSNGNRAFSLGSSLLGLVGFGWTMGPSPLDKLQQAILPAKTITILPNDDLEVSAPVLPPVITENTSTNVPPTIITVTESSWLQWLFLALWLLTSLAWIITILLNRKESIKLTPKTKNNTNILNQLISACNTNKADSVLTLIIPWAQQQYPTKNISTLDDIKHVNNNIELNHALTELQQSMYGKSPTAWNGEALLNIIKNMSKNEKNTTQKSISLNP